jgi:hypothetical protein
MTTFRDFERFETILFEFPLFKDLFLIYIAFASNLELFKTSTAQVKGFFSTGQEESTILIPFCIS